MCAFVHSVPQFCTDKTIFTLNISSGLRHTLLVPVGDASRSARLSRPFVQTIWSKSAYFRHVSIYKYSEFFNENHIKNRHFLLFSSPHIALSVARFILMKNVQNEDMCDFSRFFSWRAPAKKIHETRVTPHSSLALKASKASKFDALINWISSQDPLIQSSIQACRKKACDSCSTSPDMRQADMCCSVF